MGINVPISTGKTTSLKEDIERLKYVDTSLVAYGELGWRSGDSISFPLMRRGFESQTCIVVSYLG